ncbi:hypothetical protein OIU34_19990 [Pararhizobium sp. BT-229]|uniref:hypothetical protein n=1 Tax=Pararhizobium sp. BT-229 TaxID=2986923 RepID=UPI0021F6BAAA|nr:hypothetical protein [Pararhizobium sp. BT-229]MCV9964168.1 hypothetical protein [Pararhizobium sp. BT-229]
MDSNGTQKSDGRLTEELRKQLRCAVDRAYSKGETPEKLFAVIVDLLEAPFAGKVYSDPAKSALLKALETLGAKAAGQVEYWRRKQMEYPCLEDYFDEDGVLELPDEISPLLSQQNANGRYSEADWWLSTIRAVAADVAKADTFERACGDLKGFAKAMIACSFEGGDAHGGFIQDKAVEFGLLSETVFDSALHKDPNGWAKDGEQWFVYADVLSGNVGKSALELSANTDLALVEGIRKALPSMGGSGFELRNSTWEFDARPEQGEALVFRPASDNMIPFSAPIVVCRAPKLADAEKWRPVADYITAVSPAAVAALVKSHDSLSWQLANVTLERDANDQLARANGRRALEEYERAETAERRFAEAEGDRLEQARLIGMGGERELGLIAERDRLLRERQKLLDSQSVRVPSELMVVRPLAWTSGPENPDVFTSQSSLPWTYMISLQEEGDPSARCGDPDCRCDRGWKLVGPSGLDDGVVYASPDDAQAAAQDDFEARLRKATGVATFPEGWQLVPKEPYPEVVGAWWRYKNGHHFHDEPVPTDTSDYGAYRAMLAAMPRYPWPVIGRNPTVKGVDAALSQVADEMPSAAGSIIHAAWKALAEEHAWHITFPRAEQLNGFGPALLEALKAEKASREEASA